MGAAIGDITPLFYKKLFAAHPELERDLFNRGNQKQGEQQKALAGSIAAFATLQLDPDPARVEAILSRIAHKHASLGIKPDEYWIVHKHLFEAIVEILGEAVTPEVAAAWDEVYWLMANTLIKLEDDLYKSAGVAPGDVWRTVRVADRIHQSADTVSFVLTSLDGAPPCPGSVPDSTFRSASSSPTEPVRSVNTACRARVAGGLAHHGQASARASHRGRHRRAGRRGLELPVRERLRRRRTAGHHPRSATWCSPRTTPRCSSRRPASAAPR